MKNKQKEWHHATKPLKKIIAIAVFKSKGEHLGNHHK
jgi:hypothetical protein